MMVPTWSWVIFAFIGGVVFTFAVSFVAVMIIMPQMQLTKETKLPEPKRSTGSNPMICPPPMVGGDTVMQWAIHYHRDRLTPGADASKEYGIWAKIVQRVIAEAQKDIGFSRHFNFTDMAAQENKITATLCMVLDIGLRQSAVDAMRKAHEDYDIRSNEYDRFIDILWRMLVDYHIPQNALDAVALIASTLKPVIVKER